MIWAVIGIFALIYLVEKFFKQYGIIFVIVGIIGLVSYVAYRISKTKEKEKLEQEQFEKAVFLPPVEREPISGSYKCPSCGAFTSVDKEMFPSVNCRFCSAPMTTLIDVIRIREDKFKALSDEREEKMQMKRQEMVSRQRERAIEEKEKSKRELHKTITYLIIAIVAIALFYLLLKFVFPIAINRVTDSMTNSLNHLTDRIFDR